MHQVCMVENGYVSVHAIQQFDVVSCSNGGHEIELARDGDCTKSIAFKAILMMRSSTLMPVQQHVYSSSLSSESAESSVLSLPSPDATR